MKPIKFRGFSGVYAENQPEYGNLPFLTLYGDGDSREVVTCWRPTLCERIKVLFTGRVWVDVMTFGGPLQPLIVSGHKTFKIEKVEK